VLNRSGYIFVYNWTNRLIADSTACLHPAVAVALEVKGCRPTGQADIDVPVSISVLALPAGFGPRLNQAVARGEGLPKDAIEVREALLHYLGSHNLYQPPLDSIRGVKIIE
jgi:hypothetical protein